MNDQRGVICKLPSHISCCLFDLDGVLTSTASVHEAAWKRVFDEVLKDVEHSSAGIQHDALAYVPFSHDDYLRFVDGRARNDGVRTFFTSRSIELPVKATADPSAAHTVTSIAEQKNALFIAALHQGTLTAFATSLGALERLHDSGMRIGVVSASEHAVEVLRATGLDRNVEIVVDGTVATAQHLAGKPSPATFIHAAEQFNQMPQHCAVFEDAIAGVAAGRAGHFGLVVGIGGPSTAPALINAGADYVIEDLSRVELTGKPSRVAGIEPH